MLAGALLLLFGLVLGLSEAGGDRQRSATSGDPLYVSFHLLRQPPTGLPIDVEQQLPPDSGDGNWRLARPLPLQRHDAWLVPSASGLCLVSQDAQGEAGFVCGGREYVLHHGLFVASLKLPSGNQLGAKGRRTLIGFVPDAATSVTLFTPGFPPVHPKLRRGAFEYEDSIPASPQLAAILTK